MSGEQRRRKMKGRAEGRGLVGSDSRLAVGQIVSDGTGGACDVDQGDGALQLVMADFVEEVAEADDARGFAGKIHGQPGGGASEDANYRIQFLSATLQVGAGHGEIGAVQGGGREQQHAILRIPEFVFRGRARRCDDYRRGEYWPDRGWWCACAFHLRLGRVRKRCGRN